MESKPSADKMRQPPRLRLFVALAGIYLIATLIVRAVQYFKTGHFELAPSYPVLFWEALFIYVFVVSFVFYRDILAQRMAAVSASKGSVGRVNTQLLTALASAVVIIPSLFVLICFSAVRSQSVANMTGLSLDNVGMGSLALFALDAMADAFSLGFKPLVVQVRWGSLGTNENVLLFLLLAWSLKVYIVANLVSAGLEVWDVVKPRRRELLILLSAAYFGTIYFALHAAR